MTEFRIKTLRCEWQVVIQQVDQYGCNTNDGLAGDRVVLSRWPTYQEAYNDLQNHGYEHEHVKGRWIPNDGISAYEWLQVQYREVEVK
jgi:hypothetical protein